MKRKIISISLIIITLCSIFSFAYAKSLNSSNEITESLLVYNGENLPETRVLPRATFGYAWNSRPVGVYADSSFNSTYISQLQQAISAWNSTRVGTVLSYRGTMYNVYMVGTAIGVTSAPISPNTTVANTVTSNNGSNIIKSIVALNSNLSFNNGGTSSGTYYLKSVFMHELGHSLGLADNDDPSSIMYKYYTGNTSLSSGDINDLDSLY